MSAAFVTAVPLPPSRRSAPLPPRSSRYAHVPWSASRQSPNATASCSDRPVSIIKKASLALYLAVLPFAPTAISSPNCRTPNASFLAQHVSAAQRQFQKRSAAAVVLVPTASAEDAPVSAALPDVPTKKEKLSRISSKLSTASLRERASFYFSEFLMWNPAAKVVSLFTIILVIVVLGSFLYRLADPKHEEAPYPVWHAVRAITNPLEDDWQKNSLRATSLVMASFGMVVFAILVGMVTESVQTAVDNANGEKARVIASNHVVVCGWGSHVPQILKDVASISSNFKVAVLAPAENRQDMINQMRATITDEEHSKMKIFYRSGAPEIPQDLHRVAASQASKIILVNPKKGEPVDGDRLVLSHALALRQNLPTFTGDVVAELNTSRDEGIFRSVLSNTLARSVQAVNTNKLLFRFMAQAIGQPGLSDIVAKLMSENPSTVFHIVKAEEAAPQLVGTAFTDLRPSSVPDCVLCGFVGSEDKVYIGTGSGYGKMNEKLKASDKLLLLGTSKSMRSSRMAVNNSALELSPSVSTLIHSPERPMSELLNKKKGGHYLVLGWRHGMTSMLQELDTIVGHGTKVTIIDEDVPSSLGLNFKNIDVTLLTKRADRYETIENYICNKRGKVWDHVVVLGSAIDRNEDDSKTLATVIYVNDALSKQGKQGKKTVVTVEFINEGVADMIKDESNVGNAVLPQNLSAKLAAQTVRDSRLNNVWQELLSQEGREVYLRPVGAYKGITGKHASFAVLSDTLARSKDDILIGYIGRFDSKVSLNPQGDERLGTRGWHDDDILVVLSNE